MRFPKEGAHQKIAVLSDFDGVITRRNVLENIYREFSQADWQHYISLWEKEEISAVEEIPLCLEGLRVGRHQLEEFISGMEIDGEFRLLVDYCRKNNHYLAVVSDGLRWYIEYLLDKINVPQVSVFANEIHFTDEGLTFSFPWFDASTPLTGTSKAKIVRQIQDLGYRVLFIGDGLSDKEAARIADLVFAKDDLLDMVKQDGREYTRFTGFQDLIRYLSNNPS